MLNDLSAYTRATIFGQMIPFGLLIGSSLGMLSSGPDLTKTYWLFGIAMTFLVVWGVVVVVWPRRMARRMHAEIDRGSREIHAGTTAAALVPARVVRRRNWKRNRPWGLGAEEFSLGPAHSTAFTVLPPDGPARRVGALTPVPLNPGSSAVLALHPMLPEVGVIGLRATNDDVAAAAADPRWRSERLPTDRTVVGGYLMLLAVAIAGVLVGIVGAGLLWMI